VVTVVKILANYTSQVSIIFAITRKCVVAHSTITNWNWSNAGVDSVDFERGLRPDVFILVGKSRNTRHVVMSKTIAM